MTDDSLSVPDKGGFELVGDWSVESMNPALMGQVEIARAGIVLNQDLNRAQLKAKDQEQFMALIIEAQKRFQEVVAKWSR